MTRTKKLLSAFISYLSIAILQVSFAPTCAAQPTFIVKGIVEDSVSGESLVGSTVYSSSINKGTATNKSGQFFLWLPSGHHTLTASYVGYKTSHIRVFVTGDTVIAFKLPPETSTLNEVIVNADASRVNNLTIGRNTLDLNSLKKIPPLLGEPDVIRSLTLLPGVTSVGEGATGLNVRGGSVDQNLVLLDDAPIFNSSHLFGFLTAFNSSAVKKVELYKAGIPSSLGGRVSSVLSVNVKEGSPNKLSGSVAVSPMTASATVDGPIVKGKTSFVASGRASYSDWLLQAVRNPQVNDSKASFYDGIVKITHRIKDRHVISASLYKAPIRSSFRKIQPISGRVRH